MNYTNLLLAVRGLKKNLLYSLLVLSGLAIGIAAYITTLQWSSWHLTFDRTYPEYKTIYRLTLEENKGTFHRHMARIIHGDIIRSITFSDAFSDVEKIGRLSPFRKAIIRTGEDEYYENFAFSSDAEWLEIFKPVVLKGDPDLLLKEPHTVVMTESMARKYFGSEDPIDKTIEITHQFDVDPVRYTVTGLIKDFPDNSHLKIDLLASFDNPLDFEGTAWTYLKLRSAADPKALEENLKLYIDSNFKEDYAGRMMPRLMPVSEIHLHSHKPREILPNVQFKSVIILLITGMFVFMLSWFNFMLLSVSQHQLNAKNLVIKWQMGAGKMELYRQFLLDFILIGFISMILGITITFLLKNNIARLTGHLIFQNFHLNAVIILSLFTLLLLSSILTAWYSTYRLYRYLQYRYLSARSTAPPDAAIKNNFIRLVIIGEFVITFILISNLFLIHKQTNYVTSMQMGANDPYTIQIPNLHRHVIDSYTAFRNKVLESPYISDVTGTMEEPTGITMDAVKFSIDGITEVDDRLYLFPAEENFSDSPATFQPLRGQQHRC